METERRDVLYVKTFGVFSMRYNGKLITGKSKSSESQFVYLMQILLHYGQKGVSRDLLEETLFRNKDLTNVHHAAQSVVYNAKKKLKALGLPDVNYIIQKEGMFYWTDEIEVCEDADVFEQMAMQIRNEKNKAKKLEMCWDAIHQYTGEFMEQQISQVWVAKEARKYRNLFIELVDETAALLRENGEFARMEELGSYASVIQPLSDWETVTMEAIVATGRYEDAMKLYEDTVDYYMQEQGMRPSDRMFEMLSQLGAQIDHQYEVLDEIQYNLSEKSDEAGGYICSYPVFMGIYQVIERMLERGGQSVYLMLCTIVDSKGNPMRDSPRRDELSERLNDAIHRSVRRTDVINRYSKGQYLVLLANTTLENCRIVQKRINEHFVIGRQRTGVQYHVNSVIYGHDTDAQGLMR